MPHFHFYRRIFLALIASTIVTVTITPNIFGAETGRFKARVEVGESTQPINRAVLGVGLMYPPFDNVSYYLENISSSSVRVWSHADPAWWMKFDAALIHLNPTKILAFNNEMSRHSERVFYNSSSDNNLLAPQQIVSVLNQIEFAISRLKKIKCMPEGKFFWEIWNEPESDKNGAWKAEDMARYANDIGEAVRKKNLPVKVLVPLNMWNQGWNNELCSKLNPTLVDGLVNHYYSMAWATLPSPNDEFLSRVGNPSILKQRVSRDNSLIEKYGKGQWTLHCSEWNVHPPKYVPPFYTSRDIAVALYVLDAIKIYLESNIASAQFFLLSANNSHFATITIENERTIIRPTGAVLSLMHQYLHGVLLETRVSSTGYEYRSKNDLISTEIPYITALAAQDKEENIVLFLANKNRFSKAEVTLHGFHIPTHVNADILIGEGAEGDVAKLTRLVIPIVNGNITLPAGSITVLHFKSATSQITH